MLVPMAKVEIIGPKDHFLDAVSLVHEHGRLHIADLTQQIESGEVQLEHMDVASTELAHAARLEDLLLRARAVIATMAQPDTQAAGAPYKREYDRLSQISIDDLPEEATAVLAGVEGRAGELSRELSEVQAEAGLLARYEPILQKIQPLARQVGDAGSFESIALLVERRYKAGIDALRKELERITNRQCELIAMDVDEDTTAAIVLFSSRHRDAVHNLLAVENVNQIRLPEGFADMPLDAAYATIHARRAEIPKRVAAINDEIAGLTRIWHSKLAALRDVLADRMAEAAAVVKFGATDYTFMISGWMPLDDVPEVEALIDKRFGGEVFVRQCEIQEREFSDTPVAIRNPKFFAPYQGLMSFMGAPKYGTIDPTWMLGLFYPLFFGMIVGDVGYGAIMVATVIWLRMKYRENDTVRMATSVLGPAATSAMMFGFFYGEFFGDLPERFDWIHPVKEAMGLAGLKMLPFTRTELFTEFLLIAIAVGFLQVVLGLVLGVINGVRTKHRTHVFEKGGLLAFVLGFTVLIASFGLSSLGERAESWAQWVQLVGALTLTGGLVFAWKGGKILGIIESIGALANIASYARIMAVGLAGAIFADAANDIAARMANPVLGILVAAPLQALNFVIAAFSPNIHAVRLNFLEFFGKFYETAGQEYRPFARTGKERDA